METIHIKQNKYKSIFVSDIHIGVKYGKINYLIEFLKTNSCDNLYILGDFIDGWSLKNRWYWETSYNLLIQKLLRKSRKGTKIVYVIGNHDEFMEHFVGYDLSGIEVCLEYIHKSVVGDVLLIHGHQFDGLLNKVKWVQILGGRGYTLLLKLNYFINHWRNKYGFARCSLSKTIKNKVKAAVCYMNNYEFIVSDYAKKRGFSKIMCGHIHSPCNKTINGISYYNTGDFVENMSCIVETYDGTLKVIEDVTKTCFIQKTN